MCARCAAARSALSEWVLPAPAGRLQRLHQKRRDRDVADGALLIGRQVAEVVVAHVEARAVVGLVDHVEDVFLFGDDRVEGELLVAFAVVGFARRADAHADLVDDLLDELRAVRRARRWAVARRSVRPCRRG